MAKICANVAKMTPFTWKDTNAGIHVF